MLPVEIVSVQDTILLRARGSELLILPQHVHQLKELAKPVDFSAYFRNEALVNRPARKLFEAWLRKDTTVWTRLYRKIHHEMDLSETSGGGEPHAETSLTTTAADKAEGVEVAPAAPAKAKAKADPDAAEPAAKQAKAEAAEPEATPAPAKKAKTAAESAPKAAKAKEQDDEAPAKGKTKKAEGAEPAAKAKAARPAKADDAAEKPAKAKSKAKAKE